MFGVVNVYLDHLKFCVVCINGRRYVCCGECYVVSDECDEPTSWRQTTQHTRGGAVTAVWQTLCKLCRPLLLPAMGGGGPIIFL